MSFEQKYLKYKNKYRESKYGGNPSKNGTYSLNECLILDHIDILGKERALEKLDKARQQFDRTVIVASERYRRGYRLPIIDDDILQKIVVYEINHFINGKSYIKIDLRTGEYEQVTYDSVYDSYDIPYESDFRTEYINYEYFFNEESTYEFPIEDYFIIIDNSILKLFNINDQKLQYNKKIPSLKTLSMQQLSTESIRQLRSIDILK